MKTISIFCLTLFCCFFTLSLDAQKAQRANPDEEAIKKFWNEIWEAYQAGDTEKMWAAYTDEAGEIDPSGTLVVGKENLRASWDAFMEMVDEAPTFTYENPVVRMLTKDVAIITWDSSADIKMGGQQLGGKTKGIAVVRNIKGNWFIEFDSLTPVLPMPGSDE